MRITNTTSRPVSRKEMLAAGPADWITTRLPTNSPAPITPPSAIIVMCRRFRVWRSRESPRASSINAKLHRLRRGTLADVTRLSRHVCELAGAVDEDGDPRGPSGAGIRDDDHPGRRRRPRSARDEPNKPARALQRAWLTCAPELP